MPRDQQHGQVVDIFQFALLEAAFVEDSLRRRLRSRREEQGNQEQRQEGSYGVSHGGCLFIDFALLNYTRSGGYRNHVNGLFGTGMEFKAHRIAGPTTG